MALALLDSDASNWPASCAPLPPSGVKETGVPFLFLAQLVCKTLFNAGPQRISDLSARLKLPARIVEELVDFLRRERLCEVTSASTALQRVFTLSDLGHQRGEEYLRHNQYTGPAPVTLEAYQEQVRKQAIAEVRVTRADMERAFAGIVVSANILDQFGAAMNSGRAVFLYGPAGAGKSFIAERLVGLLNDEVYIPHSILVHDQIVRMFDPDVHVTIADGKPASPVSLGIANADARWVKCRRPVIITGGELTLDMLDLQFEHSARFYAAPPQLKANNGLLIIDDLGRQKVRPDELMNRWIVPLDRRLDYHALHTGEKFMVPFDVTVVFCTNISPRELADEAFLRRLGYKIHLGPLDEAQYREVCEQVCRLLDISHEGADIDHLISKFRSEKKPLLACTPADLLRQVRDQARYRGVEARLTGDLLAWAWNNYFVSHGAEQQPSL